MSSKSLCITMADFNASGQYIGPSLTNVEGDICFSTAIITSGGPGRVIPGNVLAGRDICFDMGGDDLAVDEVTGWTVAGGLTIQGNVTAGRNISTDCDCCDGS